MDTLPKLLIFGGGAFALYELFLKQQPAATPAPAAPSQTVTAASPGLQPEAPKSVAPAPSSFNSLDQTYARLVQQVQANSTDPALQQKQGQWFATPSVFNYYLGQVSSYALDATQMGQAFPGGDKPMSLASFWSGAVKVLAQRGLSGGLGSGLGIVGLILQGRRV